ncbi:hypothetical protein Tco_1360218 [Tanacetum coccineum]
MAECESCSPQQPPRPCAHSAKQMTDAFTLFVAHVPTFKQVKSLDHLNLTNLQWLLFLAFIFASAFKVKEVAREARGRDACLSFAFVYPAKAVGLLSKSNDDSRRSMANQHVKNLAVREIRAILVIRQRELRCLRTQTTDTIVQRLYVSILSQLFAFNAYKNAQSWNGDQNFAQPFTPCKY